jgi:hypothetical protein
MLSPTNRLQFSCFSSSGMWARLREARPFRSALAGKSAANIRASFNNKT